MSKNNHENAELTEAEIVVAEAVKSGVVADFTSETIVKRKTIRGSFLSDMCFGLIEGVAYTAKGIHIRGAIIDGVVDINDLKMSAPVQLEMCTLLSEFFMKFSCIKRLAIAKCTLRKGLEADSCSIDEMVSITETESNGAIAFTAAKINDRMVLDGTVISVPESDTDSCVADANFFMDEDRAQKLKSAFRKAAFKASAIEVRNGIFFGKGADSKIFRANGVIDITQSKINGNVEFIGARIAGSEQDNACAIDISGSDINGNIFIRDDSKIRGTLNLFLVRSKLIDMRESEIGVKDNAKISNGTISVDAECMIVEGNVTFGKGVEIYNGVNMRSSEIKGGLYFASNDPNCHNDADAPAKIKGVLDITHCKIERMIINIDQWRENCENHGMRPMLDGCVYSWLVCRSPSESSPGDDVMYWIRTAKDSERSMSANGNSSFHPQPYEHLAGVLKKKGAIETARKILKLKSANEREHLIENSSGRCERLWRATAKNILRLVGYGYDARPALIGSIAMIIAFGVMFHIAYYFGYISISREVVYMSWRNDFSKEITELDKGQEFYRVTGFFMPQSYKSAPNPGNVNSRMSDWPPEEYTNFNGLAYSLDVFLPIVNLHQEESWLPVVKEGVIGTIIGAITWLGLWIEILAGWALSTLIVASLTGIIKKD